MTPPRLRGGAASCALLLLASWARAEERFALPPRDVRVAIIDSLETEVERVDGDGLLPYAARPRPWAETVSLLKEEAAKAETPEDFGRVLHRFDDSIPNHHVHGLMPEALEPYTAPPFPFEARPESIAGESGAERWRIADVSKRWDAGDAPARGDELLAINGRAMKDWSEENFLFCKSPLRSQCDRDLLAHLHDQRLSWVLKEPLRLRLRRDGRAWEARVPLEGRPEAPSAGESARPPLCGVPAGRYPGFEPAYAGVNACVFASRAHPGVYVLRIPSFLYAHDPEEDVDSIQKEIRHLYEGFWKRESGGVRTLIVDVIDNHGGNEPIGWYRLLFDAPFQEQYAQYRKLAELEKDDDDARRLWDSLTWGEKGKESWLAGLKKDGRWAATPTGGFLPPVPQFCADDRDCEHNLFTPLPHRFKGEVRLLMNRWCVSSCVGFVYDLADVLKGRLRTFGEPDSGDSTYARLFLDVVMDPKAEKGFRVLLRPYDDDNARRFDGGVIYRQIVSVTRTTDARGRVISAKPQKIDVPVPVLWNESEDEWDARVFAAALSTAGAAGEKTAAKTR